MPTLRARPVRKPRRFVRCDSCERVLGPHVYLFGSADAGDKPTALRICPACLEGTSEPKVAAALVALSQL